MILGNEHLIDSLLPIELNKINPINFHVLSFNNQFGVDEIAATKVEKNQFVGFKDLQID